MAGANESVTRKFNCKDCVYSTSSYAYFIRHLVSSKHLIKMEEIKSPCTEGEEAFKITGFKEDKFTTLLDFASFLTSFGLLKNLYYEKKEKDTVLTVIYFTAPSEMAIRKKAVDHLLRVRKYEKSQLKVTCNRLAYWENYQPAAEDLQVAK